MDLKKTSDQNTYEQMQVNNMSTPQQQEQFGYQRGQERPNPGYYESPAQYNGGPPKHSGVGTLILVYAGIILAVLIVLFLLFAIVVKPMISCGTTLSLSAVQYISGVYTGII